MLRAVAAGLQWAAYQRLLQASTLTTVVVEQQAQQQLSNSVEATSIFPSIALTLYVLQQCAYAGAATALCWCAGLLAALLLCRKLQPKELVKVFQQYK
jgi:hypothetical protein